jgi:lipid II:glycine glycyltransferase (peptidoglycan interpeptide bridge formation enzyme)
MIRKAERAGVEVRTAGAELVGCYYGLVRQMVERTGITLHPVEYYRRVLNVFGARGQALLLLAYVDKQAVSGGIFLRFGDAAYYWHGATATGAPNRGQGELLQWQAIRWAKQAGCSWYDLVVIERDRLPQIARFKLGFSQKSVPFYEIAHIRFVDRVVRRLLA